MQLNFATKMILSDLLQFGEPGFFTTGDLLWQVMIQYQDDKAAPHLDVAREREQATRNLTLHLVACRLARELDERLKTSLCHDAQLVARVE